MRLLSAATTCIAVLLMAGFAGQLHPLGDSFAVFRVPFSIGLGVCGLALGVFGRNLALGACLVLVAIFSLNTTRGAPAQLAESNSAEFVVYQKNMLRWGRDRALFRAEIRETNPDFLMAQEITPRNKALLGSLKDVLPSQHICAGSRSVGGVGVASKFPIIEGQMHCEGPVAAMQVETPQGPVWIVSTHWDWPFPYTQNASFEATRTMLSELSGPIVLSGDLNIVPWAYAPRKIASEFGLQRIGPKLSSFYLLDYWPITIDHVFATGIGTVEQRPLLGSDHHGLLARVGLK